jgi:hypothetical protein
LFDLLLLRKEDSLEVCVLDAPDGKRVDSSCDCTFDDDLFRVLVRFNGVRGVSVVCGADGGSGAPVFPRECTPATTDAAVAPVKPETF